MKKRICACILLVFFILPFAVSTADGNPWECPVCHQQRVTEYCSVCGTHRSDAVQVVSYCPVCGRQLEAEDNFCPNDGTPRDGGTSRQPEYTLSNLPMINQISRLKVLGSGNVPVFTGAGSNYYRSASGGAAVEAGSSVNVYGKSGEWVLIRYHAVIKNRNNLPVFRFAYIHASSIQGGNMVEDLELAAVPIAISYGVNLADEPTSEHNYNSFSSVDYDHAVALAKIVENGQAWIYFECTATSKQGNLPFRGFVQENYVTIRDDDWD